MPGTSWLFYVYISFFVQVIYEHTHILLYIFKPLNKSDIGRICALSSSIFHHLASTRQAWLTIVYVNVVGCVSDVTHVISFSRPVTTKRRPGNQASAQLHHYWHIKQQSHIIAYSIINLSCILCLCNCTFAQCAHHIKGWKQWQKLSGTFLTDKQITACRSGKEIE